MAEPRDPEQIRELTAVAARELEAVAPLDALRAWWKRHYLTLGHKRLARLAILEWPLERVLADRSKGE
ncbi:MAG: hypothetical protein KatS3mg060_2201 [Dehalococcoidia bacterium]|nr:MAG: hypothetical protein KatS3mg060_2201 [Dehalococcoidia bacterium]